MKVEIKEVIPEPPPKVVTLTLTIDEVRALDYFGAWAQVPSRDAVTRFRNILKQHKIPAWNSNSEKSIDWEKAFW